DSLAGGHLAPVVLALDGPLGAGVQGLLLAFGQLLQPLAHGVVSHCLLRYRFPGGAPTPPSSEARGPCPTPSVFAATRGYWERLADRVSTRRTRLGASRRSQTSAKRSVGPIHRSSSTADTGASRRNVATLRKSSASARF